MSAVSCICEWCSIEFKKFTGEWNRSEKLGRKHFCSLSCAVAHGNKITPRGGDNWRNNLKHPAIDKLSPFRYFARNTKSRCKEHSNKTLDLTLTDLNELWEAQAGICPLTGWKLILPRGVGGFSSNDRLYHASLDRIDSAQGYVRGNVRFVSYMANICKNIFSDEEMIRFCKAVAKKNDPEPDLGV